MEQKILVEVGDKNRIFHWDRLRNMMKETYKASLKLYAETGGTIEQVERLGINRDAPRVPGYKTILQELKEEHDRVTYHHYAKNGMRAPNPITF
jgi:hypothetical protein